MTNSHASQTPARSTIYDVAAAADVSIKTVSRVLRNEPKVSAETRERVRSAMQRLAYVPHPAARSLASSVPSVIGLVIGSPTDFQTARRGSEYRMCLQMGALAAALPLGFGLRLVPFQLGAAKAADELIALARSGAVGGYLVAPPAAENRALLDRLSKADVPLAVVGTASVPEGCTVATPDERSAMRQLMSQVIELGHRRIGIVRGRQDWHATAQRMAGCVDALAAAGLALDETLVAGGAGFDFESGCAAARQLLARPQRPTAIVACSDDCAAGVMAVAHEQGLSIPQALSVTGFDDFEMAHKLCPPLTTVRNPIERMGEFATRRLIGTLQPRRLDIGSLPMRVEVACEVVVRASLGPPAKAGR
jgi:LacI family transcriptional regulator